MASRPTTYEGLPPVSAMARTAPCQRWSSLPTTPDVVLQQRKEVEAYARMRQVAEALSFRKAAADPFMEAGRQSFSGLIGRAQFSEVMAQLAVSATGAECRTAFELADKDGDGYVTCEDVQRLIIRARAYRPTTSDIAALPASATTKCRSPERTAIRKHVERTTDTFNRVKAMDIRNIRAEMTKDRSCCRNRCRGHKLDVDGLKACVHEVLCNEHCAA